VPFDAEKIPYDATGNSLLKGGLRKAFREEDYRKVQVFVTQTRESLRLQILDQMKIIKRVKSDIESFFGLRNINFSDAKWADDFAANIIPVFEIISLMIAGPEGAFKMPYLFRDEIARSFIGYIKNIIASNVDEHFACYALLGQSSCSGKSRLLSESLETESTALFIVNINCKPKGDFMGYPHAGSDSDIVEYIKEARTFNKMTDIISTILFLVFKKAFEQKEDGYYLKVDGLSKSLEELGIHYNDIAHSLNNALGAILHQTSQNLKVKRKDRTKKVILLIAFDEASYLIDEEFPLADGKDREQSTDPSFVPGAVMKMSNAIGDKSTTAHSAPAVLNTFRLIRRVLAYYKRILWHIPFVFAGSNTRFVDIVHTKCNNFSSLIGFGPNDEKWDGVTLFDPYILLAPFDVYAMKLNKMTGLKANWKDTFLP
jgi:hypothetical protein